MDKYNTNNLQKDLKKIQPFLRVNKMKPKKYYLIFVYNFEAYQENKYYKALANCNFQYIYFCMKQSTFIYLDNNDFTYK